MAKRLWDKGDTVDERIHSFTVRTDPVIDREILEWDVVGSAAHARGLHTIGVLTEAELHSALSALKNLYPQACARTIEIPRELEDCHTTLESLLTEKIGDVGKKIHTGRSRNDQILVAMRLYTKNAVLDTMSLLASLAKTFAQRASDGRGIPMPGYTHLQVAMPSSVEFWFRAFHEHIIDLIRTGLGVLESIDSCPLGAGSGFGVTLPLDREFTARVLGFARVQRNPIRAQNSRGVEELRVLRWFEEIGAVIEKFSVDLMMYTMSEFAFFSLPLSMTTGSSIMPQKRNSDVVELLRAAPSVTRGAARELESIIEKLPSSYHRDFQLTKEPFIRAKETTLECLGILAAVVEAMVIHPDKLAASMPPEIYATYALYRKVRAGKAFRDAYVEAAAELKGDLSFLNTFAEDFCLIQDMLDREAVAAEKDLGELTQKVATQRTTMNDMIAKIF